MSLSCGIVGLPNVGKSTLFNALLKRQAALAANYPFATIEPNVGVVEVADDRLGRLAEVVKAGEKMDRLPPLVPATIMFVDIAGLVAGAHKGEGLGNKFLAHIREADLICHVLRAFEDDQVVATGKLDPVEDLKTVRMELILKDVETVEKQKNRDLNRVLEGLGAGRMVNGMDLSEEEKELVKELCLITAKEEIFAVNLSEEQLKRVGELDYDKKLGVDKKDVVYINARLEAELSSLSLEDQKQYLEDLGVKESGIDQMSRAAYSKLDLISFLTAGEKEVRAWTVKRGSVAVKAAGVIHTDFEKKFIKAKVVSFNDFIEFGGWKKCMELGKVRQEGRDYVMQDGEVVEFMIGS